MVNLHALKIVHNDINPSNIMFSPKFQKTVFIDFGFSKLLNEEIGFKTLTAFKGTAEFVST